MQKHIYIIISISALIAFLFSCSKIHDNLTGMPEEYENINYEDISISTANLPLFADLGNHATKSTTAEDDSQMVSLESLLDRENIISKAFKQYELIEIPFKNNDNPDYAVLSNFIPESESTVFKSKIGLFLIETYDNDKNTVDRKVVTVIPDQEYVSRYPESELSFINKGVFSGTVLFSNLDGTFRDIYVYGGNFCPIINADVIDYSQREAYPNYGFLTLVNTMETKSVSVGNGGGGYELEPSICIATKKTDIKKNLFISFIDNIDPDDIDWNNGVTDPYTGGGGIGSGSISGSGPGTDPGADSEDDKPDKPVTTIENQFGLSPIVFFPVDEEVQKYKVSLYTAGNGSTCGSGEYQDGVFIICEAIPDSSYVFDRWTGDLRGEEDHVAMNVTSDIEATAYFHHLLATGPFRPCYDAQKDVMNPLMEMSIAPTRKGLIDFKGSTFGRTRNNGTKRHDGLDLYAEEGTPIYASYDGVISRTQRYVTCQPNRDEKTGEFPPGYSGDDNGAGNRFSIDYEKNGDTVTFVYWHLQAETPIAINPRTGHTFKPGDKVFRGEIIGYTGRTGNAYNVAFKHLHLGVKLNGAWADPADYINGELQWNNKSQPILPETKIINIKCNDESKKVISF